MPSRAEGCEMRKPLSKGECRRTLVIGPWVSAAKYLLLVLCTFFFPRCYYYANTMPSMHANEAGHTWQGSCPQLVSVTAKALFSHWSLLQKHTCTRVATCSKHCHGIRNFCSKTAYRRCFAAKTYSKQGVPPRDVFQHPTVSMDGWYAQKKHGSICTEA